jgi:hypothetical protein
MSNIEYEIPEAGHVTIKVVDIIGTPVKILLNSHESPGKYLVSLDCEELQPGKYYYKIYLSDKCPETQAGDENNLIDSGQVKIGV